MSWVSFFRPATRVLKKKKLKINVHRPVGTRVVFDEEGNTQTPFAMLADKKSGNIQLDQGIHYHFCLLMLVGLSVLCYSSAAFTVRSVS